MESNSYKANRKSCEAYTKRLIFKWVNFPCCAETMIEFYDFGIIVINGKRYASDVIVFPDRVKDNWWRKEGHRLAIEDLQEVLEAEPQVIIVGTGYSGLIKITDEVKQHLNERGIQLVIERTDDATKTFNKLAKSGEKVVAALHLTC